MMQVKRFDNRVAIVTGASRGIGRAIALACADEGARVVVNYNRSKVKAEEVVQLIQARGGVAFAAQADVGQQDAVQTLVQMTMDTWGRVDILVNNAGLGVVLRTRPMLFGRSKSSIY